jgi:hypothetical protein
LLAQCGRSAVRWPVRALPTLPVCTWCVCVLLPSLPVCQAYVGNIICPNKQVDLLTQFHEGHLLEAETYIGGHVECLESGVFRSDLPTQFKLVPAALQVRPGPRVRVYVPAGCCFPGLLHWGTRALQTAGSFVP